MSSSAEPGSAISGGGQGLDPSSAQSPRLSGPIAALIGVLAMAAALAVGQVIALFVGAGAAPVSAVGDAAIDAAPAWLKDFAVRAFGEADRVVLLLGMGVVLLLLAMLAGLISRQRPFPGATLVAAAGLVGIVAVLTRSELGQLAVLAPLGSLVGGVLVFRWLHRLAQARGYAADAAERALSRRVFLRASGGVALGAVAFGGIAQWLLGRGDVTGSRAELGRVVPDQPAPAIPPGADFVDAGTPPFITPNADFYRVDTAFVVPQVPAEQWRLRVHGMVDRELNLTFEDIRRRPLRERTITMSCVSNEVGGPYISTADFTGIPLADLLAEAGVRSGAEQLFSTSSDGYTAGTDLARLRDPADGAMLAIGMNGQPLPVEHGFPARMVAPGLYGYVSATKWVVDMELTTWAARTPYWLTRGWAREAPVKTQSRIDFPAESAQVPVGRVVASGLAWAMPRRITEVQVRVDDGPWLRAELGAEVSGHTWRMWRIPLRLGAGEHRLTCRAVDERGQPQTGELAPVTPDGATGWHTVQVTAS
ncbi:DMSO/TMAO reductase YedYZ molybdopterin-dependent catalytic subunit [Tamaricihabitans halophyticus]|uniref:DMSO/TMAO reductase YedYZ molybdopterin-dependent catalytic subunit n=1 Tax=Tamaricihabitans halophyticus TaxID=1262583 RepID=A0A4R2QT53_9PSEU|nr:molybdopterin-dependent oxidoreductase [Tamaricihabitans halophyticus]TCP53103.1 DMSO/TMAO reductase YedYZ molybdopterin-dependent catalytic subunit [Tamaricihabitans halophyticus]